MSLTDVDRAFPFADSGSDPADAIEADEIAARALESGSEEPEKALPIPDTPQPYLMSRGQKPPSEWGQPDYILAGARKYPGVAPAPWMPQLSDVRNLVRRNARFFVQNGSRPSQMHAAQMYGHSDKWWNEFAKGRHAQAQEALLEYRLQQDKLVANEQRQYKLLADAFKAYEKDPAKLKNSLISLSFRFDDPVLRDVVQTQGIQRAADLISSRHNNNLDQLKIIHQREQNAKLEAEARRDQDVQESIRQITDPHAPSPATQSYLDTGEPRPDSLPKLDPAQYNTDPTRPKPIAPLNLPETTPATSADQTRPAPPGFPAGVTPENAATRRGELTDWANKLGLPIPPPDTAGLNAWLAAHAPSGPTPAAVSPTTPAGTTPPPAAAPAAANQTAAGQPPSPQTPDVVERNRLAALAGYTPDQLDRYAWDFFIYGRLPHRGTIPKDLQALYTKQNAAVEQRVTGPNGIEEWVEKLTRAVGPAPLGQTEKDAVARADQILDKITAVQPSIGNQLRWIIHGYVQMPPAGFGATAVGPQRFRQLVGQIDPTYNNNRYVRNQRTVQAFSGNGAIGQRILAFKTAINHASTVMRVIDQMPNSPVTDYNRFLNAIKTRLGDPTATEFNATFRLFSTEVARAFRGSQTTLSEITHINENLSVNASPAQMRAGIRSMAELMQGQLDALADEYNRGTMSNIKGSELFNDQKYIAQFNRLLALPFPASTAGLKTPETYRATGNTTYDSGMSNEGVAFNSWLTANPNHPKAAALREKLRSLGWLSKGNE